MPPFLGPRTRGDEMGEKYERPGGLIFGPYDDPRCVLPPLQRLEDRWLWAYPIQGAVQ